MVLLPHYDRNRDCKHPKKWKDEWSIVANKRDGATAAVKKKWWQFWARTNRKIDENADPKDMLYQAMNQAKTEMAEHERNVANVMAQRDIARNQLSELSRKVDEVNHKLDVGDAREEAEQDPVKKAALKEALTILVAELEDLEQQRDSQMAIVAKCDQGAENAVALYRRSQKTMRDKVREQHQLLAAEDQARATDSYNASMAALNADIGDGITPTFDEARQKILAHSANANAVTELREDPAAKAMAELDAATAESAADARLAAIRARRHANELPAPAAPLAIETTATEASTREAPATVASKPFNPGTLNR